MNYITVNGWERHQHKDFAGKKNQKWFRMDAAIFDDEAVATMTASEFRVWVKMLTLAARTGNRIPAIPGYLRDNLGRNWSQSCCKLAALSLITCPDLPKKPLQTAIMDGDASGENVALEERRDVTVTNVTAPAAELEQPTTQHILGQFIDQCGSVNVQVPSRVKGQLAQGIKQLLDDGTSVQAVWGGLARMMSRGVVIPSQLPAFVMEAQLPTRNHQKRYGRGMTTEQIREMGAS